MNNNNFCSSFKSFDENSSEKLEEIALSVNNIANDLTYNLDKLITVKSEITKENQAQEYYKQIIMKKLNILNEKETDGDILEQMKNMYKNFLLDEQHKVNNELMKDITISQREQEEKSTANVQQELVELDVEYLSDKSEYSELVKENHVLQSLIQNFKISTDKWTFENIEDIKEFLE